MKKVIAIIGFLLTVAANAASFDCSKAGTPIEKAICSYPELSALDEQLASAYRTAATKTADQSQLKHEQRTWITQVRNQCENTNCIAIAYQNRINELTGSASHKPQSNQPAPPQTTTPPESATHQQAQSSTESLQRIPLPDVGLLAKPSKQDTTGLSVENPQQSGLTSLQLKLLALVLLANVLLTIYFHKSDKLIIYRDYTDAAFTGAAPLVAIVIYFVFRFFEVHSDKALIISLGILAILMFFVVKSTARNNNGLSLFFVMSLVTKVTIVGLFYAIMAALIFGSGSSKKRGESYAAYEARKRREATANAAAIAATTAGFVALSAWVCKYAEFTPIEDYFSPKAVDSTP